MLKPPTQGGSQEGDFSVALALAYFARRPIGTLLLSAYHSLDRFWKIIYSLFCH